MLHPGFTLTLAGLGLALAGLTAGAHAAADDPLNCGIVARTEGPMTVIEGVLESAKNLAGTYRFAITSSGSGGNSTISQGGAFHAEAGTAVTLGRVTLNANARTTIDFTITAGDAVLDCSAPLQATI